MSVGVRSSDGAGIGGPRRAAERDPAPRIIACERGLSARFAWPHVRRGGALVGGARALWTAPTSALGHLAGVVVSGGRGRAVGGPWARARVYSIRRGVGLDWVGAVTLGHAILARPGIFDGEFGRAILAHELAHTRQHDVLGPLYLPLHALAQLVSAAISWIRPGRVFSRVHAYNPLEQTWICVGASACGPLARGEVLPDPARARWYAGFGL